MNSVKMRFALLVLSVICVFSALIAAYIYFDQWINEFPWGHLLVALPCLFALSLVFIWWIGYLGFDTNPREKH